MQDSNPNRIKKFTSRSSLARESRPEQPQEYIYHSYRTQDVSSQQMKLVEEDSAQRHDSRAADETALLQAKINTELKNKPLDFNNPGKNTVSQTAFLQHQIDLRRRK